MKITVRRIKLLIKKMGSDLELAYKLKVSQQAIWNWLNNGSGISNENQRKLRELFIKHGVK